MRAGLFGEGLSEEGDSVTRGNSGSAGRRRSRAEATSGQPCGVYGDSQKESGLEPRGAGLRGDTRGLAGRELAGSCASQLPNLGQA